jgi:MoaA/NifB/PqqE/SkfB family radical SAM enzyme
MDIEKDSIEKIVHLTTKYSTKFARNSNYKLEQTKYEFYHVHFKPENKIEICDRIEKSDKYQWELLSRLRSNDEGRNQNRDVLSTIQELLINEDTYDEMHNNSFPEDTRIKIIWNIADTEKCGQGCSICATHSQRKNLTADQKSTVLTQILAYADHISEIDFSGGDPLLLKEDRDLILRAINNMGSDKVFVTTTQKGIKKAKDQKESILKKLLYNSEVTLDLGVLEDGSRKEYNYSNKKLFNNMINHLNEYATNIYVNVPIVNVEVSDKEIKEVVNTIQMLKKKPKRVNLLRLMKVGKCDFDLPDTEDKAEAYKKSLTNVIETFEKYAKDVFPVHLHCALRGIKEEEFVCDMRERKIGIDCAGNVFICAWGGYIDKGTKNGEDNPFYIGNALNNTLEEILNASHEKDILPMDRRMGCACCIYSYLADGNPFSGEDFLFRNKDSSEGENLSAIGEQAKETSELTITGELK